MKTNQQKITVNFDHFLHEFRVLVNQYPTPVKMQKSLRSIKIPAPVSNNINSLGAAFKSVGL